MADDGEHDDGHNQSKFGQVWFVALHEYGDEQNGDGSSFKCV